jgi:dolichyl-phosphate beta-glucosyltransferase
MLTRSPRLAHAIRTPPAAAARSAFTYEIILVDDGSKDTSVAVAEGFAKANPPKGKSSIRVLKLHKNHGKGGAVKKGMMRSSGKALLMVDADGATDINDLGLLEAVLDDQTHVAIGSRAHLENDSMAKRTFLRTVLMKGFHVFVAVVSGVRGIQDTQCGFKLFSRTAARRLFPSQHIERWAFDVELLCLCAAQSINIKEIGVRWQEIDGSKLDVMTDTINMARDLVLIRLCYLLGVWNIEPAKKSE